MTQIVLIASFVGATILIACSAWLFSRAAYWAIFILLGIAIVLALIGRPLSEIQPLAIAIAIVVYGAFVYFVTVQSLMRRKVSDVVTREDFRREMEATNRFHGYTKALYHLPVVLLIAGIVVGVIGKLSE